MTKQIREYLEYIRDFIKCEHSAEELSAERKLLLRRISFYQHERLIHLLVTLAFAIMFLMSMSVYLIVQGIGLLILSILFLILLIPYIKHYYFLENSVQELYRIYYKLERI